ARVAAEQAAKRMLEDADLGFLRRNLGARFFDFGARLQDRQLVDAAALVLLFQKLDRFLAARERTLQDREVAVRAEQPQVGRRYVRHQSQHEGASAFLAGEQLGERRLVGPTQAPPEIELPVDGAGDLVGVPDREGVRVQLLEAILAERVARALRRDADLRQARGLADLQHRVELVDPVDRDAQVLVLVERGLDQRIERGVSDGLPPGGVDELRGAHRRQPLRRSDSGARPAEACGRSGHAGDRRWRREPCIGHRHLRTLVVGPHGRARRERPGGDERKAVDRASAPRVGHRAHFSGVCSSTSSARASISRTRRSRVCNSSVIASNHLTWYSSWRRSAMMSSIGALAGAWPCSSKRILISSATCRLALMYLTCFSTNFLTLRALNSRSNASRRPRWYGLRLSRSGCVVTGSPWIGPIFARLP